MGKSLRLATAAEFDLADIWQAIAEDTSPQTATRVVTAITGKFRSIRRFPLAGALRSQFGHDIRAVFHGSYAIYYKTFDDECLVIRVLHSARDVNAIAERGGFEVD